MPIFDLYNTRCKVNPIGPCEDYPNGKKYTHLERAKPGDTSKDPGFYWGARHVGGKEGAWGNTDFLYTTLGENNHKYFKNPADYPMHEPKSWDSSGISGIRYAQPVIPDFHYF